MKQIQQMTTLITVWILKIELLILIILHHSCKFFSEGIFTPQCVVEVNGVNYSCTMTNTTAGISSPYGGLDDTVDDTTDEDFIAKNYINASLKLFTLEEELKLFINDINGMEESVWLVDLTSTIDPISKKDSQFTKNRCFRVNSNISTGYLYLSFLPVTKKYSRIQIRRNLNYLDLWDPCKKGNTFKECIILSNSVFTLQPYPSGNLVILNVNASLKMNVKIRLMQGPCNFSCSGGYNRSKIVFEDYICPKVDEDKNSVFIFDDLNPAYYCATVKSIDNNKCCKQGTGTVLLEGLENIIKEINIPLAEEYEKHLYIRTAIIIFLLITVSFIIFFSFKRRSNVISNKFEQYSLATTDEPSFTSFIQYKPIHKQPQIQALLIYYRESDEFVDKMERFATFLQQFIGKVWDPLGVDEREFFGNPVAKVMDLMQKDYLKIILVANEKGLVRENHLISRKNIELDIPYRLHEIFDYVLCRIYNTPNLLFDYRHLFLISFDSGLTFTHGVPCTRYVLPEQRSKLIQDLIS